jgi:hypothetical protein
MNKMLKSAMHTVMMSGIALVVAGTTACNEEKKYEIAVNAYQPVITTQPQGGTFLLKSTAKLWIAAHIGDGGTLSYQWLKSTDKRGVTLMEEVANATSAEYTLPTQNEGTTYYCVKLTNTNTEPNVNGKTVVVVYSGIVEVKIGKKSVPTPKFTTSPVGGKYKKNTAGIKLRAAVEDAKGLTLRKYVWYKSMDSATVQKDASKQSVMSTADDKVDTTFSELALPLNETGTYYIAVQAIASIAKGDSVDKHSDTTWSASAKIEVYVVDKPKITTQPVDITYTVGDAPAATWQKKLRVTATAEGNLSYQWQKASYSYDKDGEHTTWTDESGKTDPSYEVTFPTADAADTAYTDTYQVLVIAEEDGVKDTTVSNKVKVVAKKKVSSPKITKIELLNNNAEVRVTATGSDSLAYTYYKVKDGATTKVAADKVTVDESAGTAKISSETVESNACYYVVVTDIVKKETNKLSTADNKKTATSKTVCIPTS